jgi:citrate lyase beta subunit
MITCIVRRGQIHQELKVQSSLNQDQLAPLLTLLGSSNGEFNRRFPGLRIQRQPVHTVYGGANLYKAGTIMKLASLAQAHFSTYAQDHKIMAELLGLPVAETLGNAASESISQRVYDRVKSKLETEAIEDHRVDFEDGYGSRADEEEDGHAISAAQAMAEDHKLGRLARSTGIRVKSLSEETKHRSIRTLDLFITKLAQLTEGDIPQPFLVTLPKVTTPEQVSVMCQCLTLLEQQCNLPTQTLKLELMIETIQSIVSPDGQINIPALVDAGSGRVVTSVLGTFDYTASCNIAGNYQDHMHPAADFARNIMQVSLTGTTVTLCDGITNVMPIAPHRGSNLTDNQLAENKDVIANAWKIHFDNIMHSLRLGFYQGWDLNPAQLPVRFAAVFYFFLKGLDDASVRLRTFIGKASQASLVGNTFDDAATGQGLVNFFVNGINCGALTAQDALDAGITLEELRDRSFLKIVENRAK